MTGRLDGKAAVITGAATGIGEAIAHKFALEGAKVLINGLPDDPIEDVAQAIQQHGGEVVTYKGDISQTEEAEACVQAAIDAFGQLDILVNNAGVFLVTAETQDYPVDLFDRTIQMNIRSAFLMTKYALSYLQKSRGNIVSAGSEAGFNGLAQNAVYGGTKGWVHSFMKGVAVEQAKHGVRANCVCPGAIDTAWTHKETGPMDEQMEETLIQATPMGRRGTAEEMANVYAFLASDEASYVTGALWLADGGVTVGKGPMGDQVPDEFKREPTGQLSDLRHSREGLKNKTVKSIK
ncbi:MULTISPECIES: SDR family oxidoreductase [Cyanophyceae]|uniref:SDR family NAD(P)-dependent oxidoreductase n=1 Tax=Cyanophyceae TaxID=3028117 RepID=UPI001688149B|nr:MULTISPECIES: SDR family oxidoreductase [Cyanophyceae]MBD1914699.1 SDR family oxidoreductase [Phormidium sp. FACHB-77]MBD2032587.1 SDR family oxidoreductase [Phormidium sp. FACHB-322]MBD2049445.1 SDR family oxidoreductase [Leptolyngbya sp. FACHB-60]